MKRDLAKKMMLKKTTLVNLDESLMKNALGGATQNTCHKTIDYTISTIDPISYSPACKTTPPDCPITENCPDSA